MKQRFSYLLFLIFLLQTAWSNVLAQSSVGDTTDVIVLESAIISGEKTNGTSPNKKFSTGTHNISFSVEALENSRQNSLADFLKSQTALNIKEYGRGAGSYISLRGTSSSHTSISWNGQDMSVPTLGQTDMSHIPLYFYDNIDVHIGGNSVLYGNGSIGGSILLTNNPTWDRGISGDITMSGGSFSTLFSGGTFRYGTGKFESRSSLFYTSANNDFPFRNNTIIGHPIEIVNNAAYKNFGLLQELSHKFSDNSYLSFSISYLDFNREIQPSVSSNERPETYKSIYDNNLKALLGYKGSSASNRWKYNSALSYSYDYELYENDIIASHRYLLSTDGEYSWKSLNFKFGGSSRHTRPDVHAYVADTYEWNNEIFIFAKYSPFKFLYLSGGLRKAFVTDISTPIMPSIDIRVIAIDNISHEVSLRGSTSKSLKIPTLNDRYWGGYNVYLRPEKALTIEGGIDYLFVKDAFRFKFFTTLYRSDVEDWIRWLPVGDVWKPQNIIRVLSRGVESGATVNYRLGKTEALLSLFYNYNNVVTKESERTKDPSINKQLPYQPKHNINSALEMTFNSGLSIKSSFQFVGKRTSTDIFDILDPYTLIDISGAYSFSIFGEQFKVITTIKNILNTNYQSVKFYAMPGINCELTLQWKF